MLRVPLLACPAVLVSVFDGSMFCDRAAQVTSVPVSETRAR